MNINQNTVNKLHKDPHSQNYNLVRQPATSSLASHSQPPQTFCRISSSLKFLPPASTRAERARLRNVTVHRSQGHGTAHMLNAIKWLPHCNTQNHFTGFMFPKLHFQVVLILKHSSLILSQGDQIPMKWLHISKKKNRSCSLTLSGMSRSHSASMKSFTMAGKFCSTAMCVADAFCCGKKTLWLGRA